MGLLVEYTIKDGKKNAQIEALGTFIDGLREIGDPGYSYTAYETDEPTRFVAVLEFDDDDAKQRFLESAPFLHYRDTAPERFAAPPKPTPITRIASTDAL